MAGPPGTPRAVEIGHEFITVEWNAPTHSAGDVMRYELSVLDLVEEGFDHTVSAHMQRLFILNMLSYIQ